MNNKLRSGLASLTLVWLLVLPAVAETATVPYPPRTFLYIVDCSGSMRDYQQALNQGRQLLLDLLPENTIVVAFAENRLPITDGKLRFGGNTSILTGIREADRVLEELWANSPEQQITVVLLSDMCSTVEADHPTIPIDKNSTQCEAEIEQLTDIAKRWSNYVLADKLRFYTLNWASTSSEGQSAGVYMPFFVPSPNPETADPVPSTMPTNADILKTCVEVYAGVLTGRSSAEWQHTAGNWSGNIMTVALDDRYRSFLYLDQTPSCAIDPKGESMKIWSLPDGCCLLLAEGGEKESCTIEGVSADVQILTFTIPQPKLEVSFSADPMSIFDPVTILVAATDGKNYIGYDDSNSVCFLEVTAPGESNPQVLSSSYDPLQSCYEFTFIPEILGDYKFKLTYMILGANTDSQELVFEKKAVCTLPVSNGQQLREYTALSQKLINLEQGSEIKFSLSSYYEKPNIRLEFVVEEPEDSTIASWNPTADETGTVTVRANAVGSTVLRYTINCYLGEDSVPCSSVEHELSVSVKEIPPKFSINLVFTAVGLTLFAVVLVIVSLYRKNHVKEDGGATNESD